MATPTFPWPFALVQTWMDKFFYKGVIVNGTPYPDQPLLQLLGTGFVVADNPADGSTDVTFTGEASQVLVALTSPIAASALASGTRYLVNTSAGAFAQSLPALSGVAVGFTVSFTDDGAPSNSWCAKNLTLKTSGTDPMVDPHFIGNGGALCTGSPPQVAMGGSSGDCGGTITVTSTGTKWSVT